MSVLPPTYHLVTGTCDFRKKHEVGGDESRKKAQSLHSCTYLLPAYELEFTIWGLHINVSTSQTTGLLNGFFKASGLNLLLEGKVCLSIEAVVPFLAAFLDRSVGARPMLVQRLYSQFSPTLSILSLTNRVR